MAEIPNEVITQINNYIDVLEQNGYPIMSAYLFGSYANGLNNENSDVDLALISKKFEGNRFLDKMKILGLQRNFDHRISVLPLIEDDIQNSFFVQSEVIQKGIKLF